MTKFCTNRNKQTILIESIPYSNWEIEMVRMNPVQAACRCLEGVPVRKDG